MPAADDDGSGAMATFAAAIGTADVGNATLQVDRTHTYPEAQVGCAPCFCYDVTFQEKCVVLNFAVTCAVPGYTDWAICATTVRQDGTVSKHRGLEFLQFLGALTTNASPYSLGLEKRVDLVVAIKNARDAGTETEVFCQDRIFDINEQAQTLLGCLQEMSPHSNDVGDESPLDNDTNSAMAESATADAIDACKSEDAIGSAAVVTQD